MFNGWDPPCMIFLNFVTLFWPLCAPASGTFPRRARAPPNPRGTHPVPRTGSNRFPTSADLLNTNKCANVSRRSNRATFLSFLIILFCRRSILLFSPPSLSLPLSLCVGQRSAKNAAALRARSMKFMSMRFCLDVVSTVGQRHYPRIHAERLLRVSKGFSLATTTC